MASLALPMAKQIAETQGCVPHRRCLRRPQIEAGNTTRLAPGGPEEKQLRDLERELQEVDGIVAALSPEARLGPSCYDHRATRLADRFRALTGGPASCRALVDSMDWDAIRAWLDR